MANSPVEDGEIIDDLVQETVFSLDNNSQDNYEHVNMDIDSETGFDFRN